jgi:membrane protein
MIVLFGAEIAFASEHYETFGFQPDYSQVSIASKKFLILEILQLVIKRFLRGENPFSAREIAHTLEIPVRLVRQLLYELTGVGLVVETVEGIRNEVAFQPGRPIESITIKYALDAYEQQGGIQIPVAQSDEGERISLHLKNISDIVEKTSGNVSLKEI